MDAFSLFSRLFGLEAVEGWGRGTKVNESEAYDTEIKSEVRE